MAIEDLASRLPDADTLRRWSQSLAVLDAIFSPEWEFRYFSFDAYWGDHEQVASTRNGSGDGYSITFAAAGTYLRAFDHESDLSPWAVSPPAVAPGLMDDIPASLRPAADEVAFTLNDIPSVSLAAWREAASAEWQFGTAQRATERPDDDGGTWLFDELDGNPATYAAFAEEYYELGRPPDAAIAHVLAHQPLSDDVVRALNPGRALAELVDDLHAIGYGGGK